MIGDIKKCLNCSASFRVACNNHKFCSLKCQEVLQKSRYSPEVLWCMHKHKTVDGYAKARALIDRDGFKCGWCGSKDNLEIDHIIPRSLGGTNDLKNLRILCRDCHRPRRNPRNSWQEAYKKGYNEGFKEGYRKGSSLSE